MRCALLMTGVLLVSACSTPPPPPSPPLDVAQVCEDADGMEIGAEAGAEPSDNGERYYRRMGTRCGEKHTSTETIDGGHQYDDGTFTVDREGEVTEDHPRYSGKYTSGFEISLGREPSLSYEAGISANNKKECLLCIKGYGGSIKINLGKGKR